MVNVLSSAPPPPVFFLALCLVFRSSSLRETELLFEFLTQHCLRCSGGIRASVFSTQANGQANDYAAASGYATNGNGVDLGSGGASAGEAAFLDDDVLDDGSLGSYFKFGSGKSSDTASGSGSGMSGGGSGGSGMSGGGAAVVPLAKRMEAEVRAALGPGCTLAEVRLKPSPFFLLPNTPH